MQKCKYCGRTMTEKALERHEPLCIANKGPGDDVSLVSETIPDTVSNSDPAQQDTIKIEDQTENEEPDQQEPGLEELEALEESEDQTAAPPSFPAAMCPDTLVLKENNQMFFKVTGRRIGNLVYIEDVRMAK